MDYSAVGSLLGRWSTLNFTAERSPQAAVAPHTCPLRFRPNHSKPVSGWYCRGRHWESHALSTWHEMSPLCRRLFVLEKKKNQKNCQCCMFWRAASVNVLLCKIILRLFALTVHILHPVMCLYDCSSNLGRCHVTSRHVSLNAVHKSKRMLREKTSLLIKPVHTNNRTSLFLAARASINLCEGATTSIIDNKWRQNQSAFVANWHHISQTRLAWTAATFASSYFNLVINQLYQKD